MGRTVAETGHLMGRTDIVFLISKYSKTTERTKRCNFFPLPLTFHAEKMQKATKPENLIKDNPEQIRWPGFHFQIPKLGCETIVLHCSVEVQIQKDWFGQGHMGAPLHLLSDCWLLVAHEKFLDVSFRRDIDKGCCWSSAKQLLQGSYSDPFFGSHRHPFHSEENQVQWRFENKEQKKQIKRCQIWVNWVEKGQDCGQKVSDRSYFLKLSKTFEVLFLTWGWWCNVTLLCLFWLWFQEAASQSLSQ